MMKRMQFEKLEKEEYEKLQKMREEERLQAEEERKILDEIRKDNQKKMMPSIVRRKIQLKKKDEADYNEYDHMVKNMNKEELLKMLNDPNVDDAVKQAALRQLVEKFEVEVLEDEFGNKILVDAEGNPLLDGNNRPIMISNELLEQVGATLGEKVKVEVDPSKLEELNVLANMIKGMTEDEAKAQYMQDLVNNQLDD
jgi:antitoxin component of MazEF toxin-antitoxin module